MVGPLDDLELYRRVMNAALNSYWVIVDRWHAVAPHDVLSGE